MESETERNGSKAWAISAACLLGAGMIAAWEMRRRHLREKPQRQFHTIYADNSDGSFEHLPVPDENNESSMHFGVHPYVLRILELKAVNATPIIPKSPPLNADVPSVWVATQTTLFEMIDVLKDLECFALDTEFHKMRSYHGFTCLIQIFTGTCVYLVDAIALHDKLHVLNEVFSNPKIRKVLHGCHNDIIWLQQDFKVYLVNVFDTEKACQILKKPKTNLAHLLEFYFRIKSDKSLQHADWRRRPLSPEMLHYAQLDVSYLLHLEIILKRELMGHEERFHKAVQKSHDATLSLFQKVSSKDAATTAALQMLRRYFDSIGKNLDRGGYDLSEETAFMTCTYGLCVWRDGVAREEDESIEFILKSKVLLVLAREMPTTAREVIKCVKETPLFDFSQPQDAPTYWTPPRAFLKRVQEVVKILVEGKVGYAVWSEGIDLLDPSKQSKWKAEKQISKAEKERRVNLYSAKSKVYDNCKMLSVNGELLCYCDRRNLEWYVRKKIARVESTDPYVIRLLFQHRISDEQNGCHEFYVQSRENLCVACGEDGHYLRYKIVPAIYRRHFPVELKSHRSHDVVLLCIDCHHIAQTAADKLKRQLAEEYGVPLSCSSITTDINHEVHPNRVRAAALALQKCKDQIPPRRVHELEKTIHTFFGRDPSYHGAISHEELKLASLVSVRKKTILKEVLDGEISSEMAARYSELSKECTESGEYIHGKRVVAKAFARGGEAELYTIIRRFREVFVDALQPQHLPNKWNVDHFAPRRFGEHSIFYQGNASNETQEDA